MSIRHPNRDVLLHIVLNDFAPDYRVLKEASALESAGHNVIVQALGGRGRPDRETVGAVAVHRFRLSLRHLRLGVVGLVLKYLECVMRMTAAGLRMKPAVVHAHDLNALPIGWLISVISGRPLVYDSHELWSDSNHRYVYPKFIYLLALIGERLMARRASEVITVSDGIANRLRRQFKLSRTPAVIRNVPEAACADEAADDWRNRLGIPSDACVFLYIGGLLQNRGVDLLVDAFARSACPNTYLIFLGAIGFPNWMRFELPSDIRDRIRFQPPVSPRVVVSWAGYADVGVHAIRGTNESHRLCLPNKLFEYLQAGLAVIVTDLPEMSRVVRQYDCGRLFTDGDVDALATQMRELAQNPATVAKMRDASRMAAQDLTWAKEKYRLLSVYERLTRTS